MSNLRAWVVGFAAWLTVDQVAGWRASEGAPGGGARGMGAFFALFLVVRMVRILWPMRAAGADSSKLVAGGRTLAVHRYTGLVSDVDTTTTTTSNTHGSVWNVGSTISGNIQTDTHVTRRQQFFLNGDDGVAQGFLLRHDNIMLGQNQRVSGVTATAPLRRARRNIVFLNHTTRSASYPGTELAALAIGGSPALAGLWAFLTLGCFIVGGSGSGIELGFAGLFFIIVVSRLQASFFKHVGSRSLVNQLLTDQAAESLPAPASAAASASPSADPVPSVLSSRAPLPSAAPAAPQLATVTASPSAAPAAPPTAPPSWLADPHHRHELRWWDGGRWTEHVSNGGVASTDPA